MYAPLNVNKLKIRNPTNPEIPFGSTVIFRFHVKRLGYSLLRRLNFKSQPKTSMSAVWNPTCESSIEKMWIETRQNHHINQLGNVAIFLLLKHLCHVSNQLGNWETTLTNLCEDWRCHGGGKQSQAYGVGEGGTSATPMLLFQRLIIHPKTTISAEKWCLEEIYKYFFWNWPLFPFQGTCYIFIFREACFV